MPRKPFRQMPISSIGSWDGARVIDAIIDEVEIGHFFNGSLLVDQVLRDDRLRGVLSTRVGGLLGRDFYLKPAKDTARGRKIAEEIEEGWETMFPAEAVSELLTWGILLGVGLAQIVAERVNGELVTSLEAWHPQALRYDDYKGAYFVRDAEGQEIEIVPGNGQWVLYTPFGFRNPGRRGLLRSVAHLYLERRWAHRDRARYSEVHGQPMRVGILPASASDSDKEDMEESLSLLGAEAVVVVKQGTEGNKGDVKLVEASGRSQDLFEGEIAQLDRAIAVLLLGQSQSTDGQAGLGANAQAGEPVRLDVMRQDASSLASTLKTQALEPYCAFAYGDAAMAPYPCWEVDPPEDKAAKATELSTLVTALAAAKAAGLPLDERAILEEHGVPMISEEEQSALDAAKAQEAANAMKAQQDAMKTVAEGEQPPMKNGVASPSELS
jgi:phage gp29-like protein